MSSPQPQTLSVHPTPRGEAPYVPMGTLASPPPRSPHHWDAVSGVSGGPPAPGTPPPAQPLSPPPAAQGATTTAHHVWTVGTSKRNTKSALRTSALARHNQQALQQERRLGGGNAVSAAAEGGGEFFPAVLDQQLHYGVAGYRSDHGGVSFYRTSVHKKDPQNVILSHGVMSRVVDLRASPGKPSSNHMRTISGGWSDGGGGTSAAMGAPPMLGRYHARGEAHAHHSNAAAVHAPLEEVAATQSLDGERVSFTGSANNGIGPSPPRLGSSGGGGGGKPRWNAPTAKPQQRGSTPPPPMAEGGAAARQRSPHGSRRHTPPSHQARVRGASPQNIRSALAGNRDGVSGGAAGGRLSSSSIGRPSPPRVGGGGHNALPAAYGNAPSFGGGVTMAGHVSISNHSGRQGHHTALPSGRASSTSHTAAAAHPSGSAHNTTSGSHHHQHQHDCRDSHCLHSRGNIMEVIAAKSQVRAMESQLLHEEIRREQLATALSSERERSQRLSESLAKAEVSLQNSQIQVHDSAHWYEAYELRDKEARSFEERMLEAQAALAVERETNKRLSSSVEQHETTIDEQRKEIRELVAKVQRLQTDVADLRSHQQQVATSTAMTDGPSTAAAADKNGSYHGSRRGSIEASSGANSTWGADSTTAMRDRLRSLEADLARAAEERQSDERLRRELLRALADKEKQLAALSLPSSAAGSSNNLRSATKSTLTASPTPPPADVPAAMGANGVPSRVLSGSGRQLQRQQALETSGRGVPPSLVSSAASSRRNLIHASSTTTTSEVHHEVTAVITSSTSMPSSTDRLQQEQQMQHRVVREEASSSTAAGLVVSADDSLLELNVTALSSETAAGATGDHNDDDDETTAPPRINVTHRLFNVDPAA